MSILGDKFKYNQFGFGEFAPHKQGAWQRYKYLREYYSLSLKSITDIIHNISLQHLAHGALFAVLYLSGARVEEVCRPIHETKEEKVIRKDGTIKIYRYTYDREMVLKVKDIFLDPPTEELKKDEIQFFCIRTKVLKTRDPVNIKWRVSDTPYNDLNEYSILIDIIEKYLEAFFKDPITDSEKVVFPISSQAVRGIFNRYKVNPHYLRNLRASHLMKYHNFSPAELKKFFCWKSELMPIRYSDASRLDIREKLLKNN